MANTVPYRSIAKPKVGGSSGFSSYASSLTKKLNSAEDAVIDQQYSDGVISADTYKTQLQSRLTRNYLTPLQVVTLQQKINDVDEKLTDSKVDTMYKSGELTTAQVLEYEKAKLARITEQDSVAYQKQQQVVQQLTDKSEREARTAFRVKENLRISQLPDDTSANLYQKAKEYETLAAQARQDGDNQQADVFDTSRINYLNAAKKADINDLITNTRLGNSQTPDLGLGVPSAEAGQQFYGKLTGATAPTVSEGSDGAAAGTKVQTGGISTPALRNAYEALDRGQKAIERLYGSREDKQNMLKTYADAIAKASGDQKTQLTIAYNNLKDDIAGIDNQIGITTQNLQDTVGRIQEIQQKAAAGQFSQEVRKKNVEFTQAENDLETKFAKGELSKEEYLSNATQLAQAKLEFFSRASDGFAQFGNENSADSYLQKATDFERIATGLQDTYQNIGDYESLHVDPGGKISNIFGTGLKPGEFALTNVRRLRDQGLFDSNYTNINGKYYRVNYPNMATDSEGQPISRPLNQDFAKLNNESFIYRPATPEDVKTGKASAIGQMIKDKVAFYKKTNPQTKDVEVTPLLQADTVVDGKKVMGLQSLVAKGAMVQDKTGAYIAAPTKDINPIMKAAIGIDDFITNNGGYPKFGKTVPYPETIRGGSMYHPFQGEHSLGFLKEPANVLGDIGKYVLSNSSPAGKILETITPVVKQTIERLKSFFAPEKVQAAEPANVQLTKKMFGDRPVIEGKAPGAFNPNTEKFAADTPDEYKQDIINASKKYGISTAVLSSLLKQESSFDPDVINGTKSSPVGAQGIAQFMPATARSLGIDPLDPHQAIEAAARYLKSHLDNFGGDLKKALAAYNAGPGNVQKYGGIPPFAETQNYVKKILGEVQAATPAAVIAADANKFKTADDYVNYVKQATPGAKINEASLRSNYATASARSQQQAMEKESIMRSMSPEVSQSGQLRSATPSSSQPFKMTVTSSGPTLQSIGSSIGSGVKNLVNSVQNYFRPPVISPIPSPPKPTTNIISQIQKAATPVIQTVQKAAAPVVSTVQKAISNVSSFISNLFKRK